MRVSLIPTIDGCLPKSKTQLRRAIQHRPASVAVDILRDSGWETVALEEMPPGLHVLEVLVSPTVELAVEIAEGGAIRVRI